MSTIAHEGPEPAAWVGDPDDREPSMRFDSAKPAPRNMARRLDNPTATASIVPLDSGLYTIEIGESAGRRGQVGGMQLPVVQVSALSHGKDPATEIIDTSGSGDIWVGSEGGTVIVRSPPGGGRILVTSYGLPGQIATAPEMEIHRLDRSRPNGRALPAADETSEPEEVRTEIVLHIERSGDRRFSGEGWVGNRGKKLRIEAFSIRPVNALLARDIEFKALGPKGRETPWVTDAKLCGTRGQGLPLTGFAVRLTPSVCERFEVVYEGAFFESGIVGPKRNGELCVPPIADDPLEAINVRLVSRAAV
jgi:hypothetical protein